MREAELDLFLENFRAIADERMADIVVTPELKERVLFAALEAPQKRGAVSVFAGRRVVWSSVAVAAALLVAALGGSGLLFGGGRNAAQSPMEAAVNYGGQQPSEIMESGEFAADEPVGDYGALADDEAAPEEGPACMLMPPPEPEAPADAAGVPENKDAEAGGEPAAGGGNGAGGSSKGGAAASGRPEEEPREQSALEDEIVTDGADMEIDEQTEEEPEDSAIMAGDPEADIMFGECQDAQNPMAGVTAVFTGEVVSAQFLTISLKDGTTVSAADAASARPGEDQPQIEGGAYLPPVYGCEDGGSVYVVVTSYRVQSVYCGGAVAGTVVRVLGAGGTVGASEVVAVSGVENRLSAGTEIRYDLVAEYALILADGDTSTENVSRITGMIDAG